MSRQKYHKLGIPLERTVQDVRPGRWMPVVWILFAAMLTGGIVMAIRFLYPEMHQSKVAKAKEPLPVSAETPASGTEPAPVQPEVLPVRETPTPVPAVSPTPAETVSARPSKVEETGEVTLATLVKPIALEQRKAGRVNGVVYLKAGQQVEVISREGGGMVRVRWKELEGAVAEGALEEVAVNPRGTLDAEREAP